MPNSIKLVIPLLPVSVNHYVRHTRSGRHYLTKEAKAFKNAVAIIARRKKVDAQSYHVDVHLYLGHGQRGDVDNFNKLVLDALVDAGVIHSDAAVSELFTFKYRDRGNPRTEISVEGL